MAVTMRLTRQGGKKKPFYRIVVADSEAPRDGSFLEIIGHYNPMVEPPQIEIQKDRADFWLTRGATPSDTVKQLLKKAKDTKAA